MAAIVAHHPDARYFAIGGSRVEQLIWELGKAMDASK
jgi:hypothetical protein